MSLLALDVRWRRLMARGGVFDIGFDAPDDWPHSTPREAGTTEVLSGDDRLSADLCRLGDQRFICALLPLPIRGSDEVLQIGLWAEVPPDAFYAYIDHATEGAPFADTTARLATTLPLPSDDATARLTAGAAGHRPGLQASGALGDLQQQGLSLDDLLDLYAACGQDIRPDLSRD